jgi:hypothetical protein
MKKSVILSAGAILGIFLLHQSLRKSATHLSSPDTSAHSKLIKPVSAVQAIVPRDELVRPDNVPNPSDTSSAQLEAAQPTYNPTNHASFLDLQAKLRRSSPAVAAHFAESLPVGPVRNEALLLVAQNWAAQDSASAEAWAAQLPDKNESQAALANVCFKVSEANAAQAVQMAVNDNLSTMPGILENLVSQWANQDFSGAVAWTKNQPSSQQRDQIFERLAVIESGSAPAEAAKLLAEQIAPGPVQDDAVVSVLYMWATHDMAGAMAWVDQFPSGALKDRAKDLLSNIAASNQRR